MIFRQEIVVVSIFPIWSMWDREEQQYSAIQDINANSQSNEVLIFRKYLERNFHDLIGTCIGRGSFWDLSTLWVSRWTRVAIFFIVLQELWGCG